MNLKWHTEQRKINDLIPYEQNPRQMTEEQVENLKKSLERFDLVEIPAIDTDNKIIAGHQRLKILQLLGRGDEIIDVRLPNRKLTTEEFREYNLRSNKNVGEWDWDMLANFDMELLEEVGFVSEELDKFREVEEDEVPEVSEGEPIAKLGEVYQLGNHRLMCGDSTKIEDVEKLMDGQKANMVFTDPPYAVNYGADQDLLNKKSGNKFRLVAKPIIGDNLTTEECAEKLWRPAFRNMYESAKDDCSFYMTMCQGGDQMMMMMMMMMMSENWQIKHELIWVKSSPVFSMGRLDYDYQHEPILFGWKKKHNFYKGGKFLNSIWEIPKPSKSELHPTMKPIELIANCLGNSSKRGDIVLDLFGGSGSTLIACEQLNRRCFMSEIDPKYIDVTIKRWEQFTGNKATKCN